MKGETVPLSLLPNGKLVQIAGSTDDPADTPREAATEATPVGGAGAVATAEAGSGGELAEVVPRCWRKRLFGRSDS